MKRDRFDWAEVQGAREAGGVPAGCLEDIWFPTCRRARLRAAIDSGAISAPYTRMMVLSTVGRAWNAQGIADILNSGGSPERGQS